MAKPQFDVHKDNLLLDHSTLTEESDLKYLLPIGLTPIKVTRREAMLTSSDLITNAENYGAICHVSAFSLYSRGKFGTTRRENNTDLPNGYSMFGKDSEPLDLRVNRMKDMRNSIITFAGSLEKEASQWDQRLWEDEEDDMGKFNYQRVPYQGRHLQLPFSENLMNLNYPPRFIRVLQIVIRHYATFIKGRLPSREAILQGTTDAVETAPGGPSFLPGGTNYNEARIANLLVQPPPDYKVDPVKYLQDCYNMGRELGLPMGEYFFSSYLSFRFGQKRKPLPLWYPSGTQWVSTHEAQSLYPNQRAVFPGAFGLNLAMNPAVYAMKLFRKSKLGMWHTPELEAKYIPMLQKQGDKVYMSDFSNFDMTIANGLMRFIMQEFATISPFAWEFSLFNEFLKTTGVIYPSFHGEDSSSVTFIQGMVSLLSGWYFTSEIGSIMSIASNLYALEEDIPTVVNDWVSGKFIVLDQGDDILFTSPKEINAERFAIRINSLGLRSKLQEGAMFLKKLLPLGYLSKLKGPAKPVSRLITNTWGNEENYSDKPDSIIRLGLYGRSDYILNNPVWSKLRDQFVSQLETSEIYRAEDCLLNFDKGVQHMSSADVEDIMKYTESTGEGWLTKLMSRADADPYAARTLQLLQEIGVNVSNVSDELLAQRRTYLHAWHRPIDQKSMDAFANAKAGN